MLRNERTRSAQIAKLVWMPAHSYPLLEVRTLHSPCGFERQSLRAKSWAKPLSPLAGVRSAVLRSSRRRLRASDIDREFWASNVWLRWRYFTEAKVKRPVFLMKNRRLSNDFLIIEILPKINIILCLSQRINSRQGLAPCAPRGSVTWMRVKHKRMDGWVWKR